MYIYISLSRVLCSFGSKKQTDMAAELPIDDEVAHGNMPAKGTKVAKLVAMAKGFLPECKVQDFPPEPEMACMKMSCFMSCWFAERISKPDARLIFGEAYPYLKGGEKNAIINKLTEYRAWLKKKKANLKNGEKTNLAVMQVLRAMDGHGVQAGSASKPEKRLTKKTPQPAEGSTEKEPSQPSQPAKAIAEENSQPKIMLAEAVDSSQSMAESETASQISLQEISSSASSGPLGACELGQPSKPLKRPASASSKTAPAKKPAMAPKPAKAVHMATQNTWVASCSFGWVKMGSFSEKGYILARNGSEEKAKCVVNVNLPRGENQTHVLQACFNEAQKPGLDKAHMVDFKNNLLKSL